MIEKLVSDLPEIYQPIYGHPELSDQVSRPCFDRLERIAGIHDALQRQLGRPLNVLDLGCAQGYFSLSLAERGATVYGIDYLDKNVAVCNALAQAHPQLNASFETGRAEDVIERLEPGSYDLVLGLSVFHHIVHEKGVDVVKGLLERVAHHCGALIVELALRDEPLYWAAAQPEDPRILLEPMAFVHEVARHATHLAPIPRPLFVASNRYWILEDRAELFDSWSADPHVLAHGTHEGSRRYFFCTDCILKMYRLDHPRGAHNKAEFNKEVQFLQSSTKDFPAPALIVFGESKTTAWLATQRLPGRLLVDLLREGVTFDSRTTLLSVLAQLAALEKAGLYHDDVRTWNVLVVGDGATHLIDYGSISTRPKDCAWPTNIFLSFFIFVREVATGVVDDPDPLRTISISPYGLPQPYQTWANALWQRPLAQWSFGLMHQTFLEMPVDGSDDLVYQPFDVWMKATEEAIQAQKNFSNRIRQQVDTGNQQLRQVLENISIVETLEKRLSWVQEKLLKMEESCVLNEKKITEVQQRAAAAEMLVREHERRSEVAEIHMQVQALSVDDKERDIAELSATAHHWQQEAGVLEAERNALRQSASWRITAPLRGIGRGIVQLLKSKNDNSRQSVARHPAGAAQRLAVLLLNKGVAYAQSSPRFRRFVLRGLARTPSFAVKLRQMHMASQLGQVSSTTAWSEPSNAEKLMHGNIQNSKGSIFRNALSLSNGVNSKQKTPLEANFPAYGRDE